MNTLLLVFALASFDAVAASLVSERDALPLVPASAPVTILNEISISPVSDDPAIHQSHPAIASDGESFLLVWRESAFCCSWHTSERQPGSLYAVRLDLRGRPFSAPTLLSSSAAPSIPALAFDGTNYLVVWTETALAGGVNIMAQRLTPDAVRLDAAPVHIRNAHSSDMQLAAACGSDDCLAIFDAGYALLSKNGGVLRLSLEFGGAQNAAIATPGGYAATSIIGRQSMNILMQPTIEYGHAYAELPFSQGKLEGPYLITFPDAYANERISSSISSDGSSILIAAVHAPTWHPRELFLVNVPADRSRIGFSSSQTRLEVPPMDGYPAMILYPRTVWNGSRFLVVYQRSNEVRFRPDPTFTDVPRPMTRAELAAIWIEADGSVSRPSFDITQTEEIESLPALASDGKGAVALAFVREIEKADTRSARLFVTTMRDGVPRSRPVRR